MRLAVVLCLLSVGALRAAHWTNLTWQDSTNPACTTYNVYVATSSCASNPTFTLLAQGLVVTQYTHVDLLANSVHCYYTTAVLDGVESGPSNMVEGDTPGDGVFGVNSGFLLSGGVMK